MEEKKDREENDEALDKLKAEVTASAETRKKDVKKDVKKGERKIENRNVRILLEKGIQAKFWIKKVFDKTTGEKIKTKEE
ncbi:MAG: hypothetical protein ACK4ND_13930 [Cytophagaceae bacterium]